MNFIKSEADFIKLLNHYDNLLKSCAQEKISFSQFLSDYDDFYCKYALDGHESDQNELDILLKYTHRIIPHKLIFENVLSGLCDDNNEEKKSYKQEGRFGSKIALEKLKEIVASCFPKT